MLAEVSLFGPELVLMCVGGILLIAELIVSDKRVLVAVAIAAVLGSLAYSAILLVDGRVGQTAFDGILVFDRFSLFFQFLLGGIALVVIVASWETIGKFPSRQGEYLALLLFSTSGLMLLAGTRDLIGICLVLLDWVWWE